MYILPSLRYGKLLYQLRVLVKGFGIVEAKVEELQDWIWIGVPVNVSIIKRCFNNVSEFIAEDLSMNDKLQPMELEPIKILSFDESDSVLSIERSFNRRIFLKITEPYLKDMVANLSKGECYALLAETSSETKLLYIIDAKEYRILLRARSLMLEIIDDYRIPELDPR